MKQIFTFIAVMFSVTTFAAPGPKNSKISISSNDRFVTQVKIDGVMYNLNNTFVFDNIRSGNHTISIYKTENAGFRRKTQMIYNSSMFISPAQMINIDVNRNGKVVVKTTTATFDRDDRYKGNNRDFNDRDNRNNNNNNNNYGRH